MEVDRWRERQIGIIILKWPRNVFPTKGDVWRNESQGEKNVPHVRHSRVKYMNWWLSSPTSPDVALSKYKFHHSMLSLKLCQTTCLPIMSFTLDERLRFHTFSLTFILTNIPKTSKLRLSHGRVSRDIYEYAT